MFSGKPSRKSKVASTGAGPVFSQALIEALEDRRMLSGSVVYAAIHHVHHAKHAVVHHAKTAKVSSTTSTTSTTSAGTTSTTSSGSSSSDGYLDGGQIADTITFSEAPTAVQTGLKSLAAADSLAVPTASQTVYLGNRNGVESYTLDYSSSGTITHIAVDQTGAAVSAPTETTSTFGALSGTGTGSDSAAAAEITAIATALGLTAPTSSTVVYVTAQTGRATLYTVHLGSASTTATSTYPDFHGNTISVDASGNPVGHQDLPFSVIPSAIQNGFNANLPTGAAALAAASTQSVKVETVQGVTLYSTTFTSSGTSTTVTMNSLGALTSLPTDTSTTFADLPAAVQNELQTLATADVASGTISSSASVDVYTEANGTKIYSVQVSTTNSSSQTVTLTISVDGSGNPTVSRRGGFGDGGCGGGGGSFDDGMDSILTGGWGGADSSLVGAFDQ